MSSAQETKLPTVTSLGVSIDTITNADPTTIATRWLESFAQAVQKNNVDGVVSLLTDDAWWRDVLAMTWDFRSFHNKDEIQAFLHDRLSFARMSQFKLSFAAIDNPYDDLAWIRAHYTFESHVGGCSGVFRLVPVSGPRGSTWKAFNVFTNLESLKGHPESLGPLRDFDPNHGKWLDKRRRESEYADRDPEVLVVGGGQSGLEIAARLKLLGVDTLICEKQARVGDQWRHRYAALCLHDVVWYDHMPYIPFPENWPVYCPAQKLADWLEAYAKSMELNVWTSTTVRDAKQEADGKWAVTVDRGDTSRVVRVDHVVFAIGVGGGTPNMPDIPGKEKFQGQILHSTQHDKALDHAGKKVVVVGACTSAHDIASDYADNGVDVTLYQRSPTYIMTCKEGMPRIMKGVYWEGGPPTDVADLIDHSLPVWFKKQFNRRVTRDIAEADSAILKGLDKRGFRMHFGDEDSGLMVMVLERLGGYYLDVGASQKIIDGDIKLKSDPKGISQFTETGIKSGDGSELKADVVLFATGYGDPREPIRKILGPELGKKLPQIWGLPKEGEVPGCWKELNIPNCWLIMGNFAMCRFYSKRLALPFVEDDNG
ncbi:FAD/NAD-P-binding domain-containing protein [Cytidiella melzeri]|nr:FAD/NAD-P-binding domain-containing protein [Cytidiella melzeri]